MDALNRVRGGYTRAEKSSKVSRENHIPKENRLEMCDVLRTGSLRVISVPPAFLQVMIANQGRDMQLLLEKWTNCVFG